jgi:hypothetical protein
MPNRDDVRKLADELLRDLEVRLQGDGWTTHERLASVPPSPFAAGHLVTFSRSLKDGFIATATFSWMQEDASSSLVVAGHVGLDYEPAGALLAALTDPEVMGVVFSGPRVLVEVSEAGGVREAAEQLALFAGEQARPAESVRSIDTVIELLRDDRAVPLTNSTAAGLALDDVEAEDAAAEQPDGEEFVAEYEESPAAAEAKLAEAEAIAVLLAVVGRHDEARRVLAAYEPPGEEVGLVRMYRRFERHFMRFLDSGGELPPPRTPPRWPPSPMRPEPAPSFSQAFAERLPEVRARQDAVKAVRAVSQGKTRDELRTLFEKELDERGVKSHPSDVDTQVDLLATERESFGKARIAVRGLKALGELAGLRREPVEPVAEGFPPEPEEADTQTVPEPSDARLELPERAAYPIAGSPHRRVAVELDPAARALLDRVAQRGSLGTGQTPRMVLTEAWLTWDTGPSTTEQRLNVHIGAERVGQLGPDVAEQFRPAMEAAAERDEDQWVHAHLAASSGTMPYLLEISLPKHGGR